MLRNLLQNFSGLQTFMWVWFGQVISILGSAMTRFALMIWAYEQTGSATSLALLGTFNYIPYLILSPVAGVVVDRWDRRKVMFFSDLLAGMMTVAMLLLFSSGSLEIWHIYVAEAVTGGLEAFQVPAYLAATSMLVPKDQYARTNGLRALGANASRILAPALAGVLMPVITISGIMAIDVATFTFSSIVLLFVIIPRPPQSDEGAASRGSILKEMRVGLSFILPRRGLVGLLLVLFGMNMLASLTYFSILPAMILARSGGQEWALGVVQSVLAGGGLVGAFLMSTWGGPRKQIHGVLLGGTLSFLFGDLLFALGQNVWIWAVAAFASTFFIPFISGGAQAIWQTKVPPDLQGRVFTIKDMLQQVTMPFGYLLGGILADQVFEPALSIGGALSSSVITQWVGVGPGAGMGLMFIFTCILGTLISVSGYLSPSLRQVEEN